MREEIPQWNWYNGQFLWAFEEQLRSNPTQTIGEFFADFKKQNGLEHFPFHLKNQGAIISLLYALLVVPREIWERDTKRTAFPFSAEEEFHVTQGRYKSVWDFLRLLRNSISHAQFAVDVENNAYRFWNIDKGKKTFEVEISQEGLGLFLTEIGKYYINEVKDQPVIPPDATR